MRIRGFTIEELFSIPKSFIICWKLFGFKKALICPIFISNRVKCMGIKRGKVLIDAKEIQRGMINIGLGGSIGISERKESYFIIGATGIIVFKGTAGFSKGCSLRVDGKLTVGNNFSINKNSFISCASEVSIGNNVLIGWNVNIRDSDGHKVYHGDIQKPSLKPVGIGNHVWIASEVDILKGVVIPDDCIIGYRSCVTKSFDESHCLLSGYPAKILKHDISWKK